MPNEPVPIEERRKPRGLLQRFTEFILSFFETRIIQNIRDTYLEEGEEIVDYIPETLIPAFDFRWVILTDRRVILATRYLLNEDYRDMSFDNLEFEYTKGTFLFDEVRFERFTSVYKSQFYSFYRDHLLRFTNQLEEEMKTNAMPDEEERDEKAIHTLKDLFELKEMGIISEEEFNKRKEKLLDELKD